MKKLLLVIALFVSSIAIGQKEYVVNEGDVTFFETDCENVIILETPQGDFEFNYVYLDYYDEDGIIALLYYGEVATVSVGEDWASVSYMSGEIIFWYWSIGAKD